MKVRTCKNCSKRGYCEKYKKAIAGAVSMSKHAMDKKEKLRYFKAIAGRCVEYERFISDMERMYG
jgi:hypothetical protein